MKSSYKALKINSLCYRDRFVKQFPLFLNELKDLKLYDDFKAGLSSKDSIVDKDFYDLSLNYKNFYNNRKVVKMDLINFKNNRIKDSWTNPLNLNFIDKKKKNCI